MKRKQKIEKKQTNIHSVEKFIEKETNIHQKEKHI
jgi:hypothetical protein